MANTDIITLTDAVYSALIDDWVSFDTDEQESAFLEKIAGALELHLHDYLIVPNLPGMEELLDSPALGDMLAEAWADREE